MHTEGNTYRRIEIILCIFGYILLERLQNPFRNITSFTCEITRHTFSTSKCIVTIMNKNKEPKTRGWLDKVIRTSSLEATAIFLRSSRRMSGLLFKIDQSQPLFELFYLSIRFYNSCRRLPETKRHSSLFLHWSVSKFLVVAAACTVIKVKWSVTGPVRPRGWVEV